MQAVHPSALVDPAAVGLGTDVFVEITLTGQDEATLEAFEVAVSERPEIMSCHLMAGQFDYLVHVVDASAPDPEGQIAAVREVLSEIDAAEVPELLVFNKVDLAPDIARDLVEDHVGSVGVSAVTGQGIELFLRTLADRLRALTTVLDLLIPYERGDVLASVHREGEVVSTTEDSDGFRVRARLSDASAGRLSEFVVTSA